jgi:hypothetical protein
LTSPYGFDNLLSKASLATPRREVVPGLGGAALPEV